jgi:hypothetical protein
VTSTSFDIFIEEWDHYRSTNHHNHELVSFVVIEQGTYNLGNDIVLEAKSLADPAYFGGFATHTFDTKYDGSQVVFSQTTSYNDANQVWMRQSEIVGNTVKLKGQTDNGTHATENVSVVAIGAADNTAPTVDVDPDSKSFNDKVSVTITTNDNTATIYYTTDGSTPTASSTVYTGAFDVTTTTTVKAIAIDPVGNESSVDSETYTLDNTAPTVDVDPASKTFNDKVSVTITTNDNTATIYYTTDGSTPTASSTVYTGAFDVTTTTTVKAIAIDPVGNESTVDSETYVLDGSAPLVDITPETTQFYESIEVTIGSTDDESVIYFTTDGSTPTASSTIYTGPFDVTTTTTVKAIAIDQVGNESEIDTETYTKGYRVTFSLQGGSMTGDNPAKVDENTPVAKPANPTRSGFTFVRWELEGEEYDFSTLVNSNITLVANWRSNPTPPPPTPPPGPTVSISLDKDPVELEYGTEADPDFFDYDLTETITGSNDDRVTWSIDDPEIASVDDNGVVTAIKQGETTVTVTHVASGDTDSSTVIVFLVGDEEGPLGAVEFYDPYVYGYPDGTFGPERSVTRAEIATMFAKILKLNLDFPGTQKFSDVKEGEWYYEYVQAIARTGLFVGDGDGSFRPNDPISRGEMAVVFAKYWEFLDIEVDDSEVVIPDVDSSQWYSEYVYKMYNAGIVAGFEDGTYRPNDPTLREQVVGMINTLIARPEYRPLVTKYNDITPFHWAYGDIEAATTFFNVETQLPVEETGNDDL